MSLGPNALSPVLLLEALLTFAEFISKLLNSELMFGLIDTKSHSSGSLEARGGINGGVGRKEKGWGLLRINGLRCKSI